MNLDLERRKPRVDTNYMIEEDPVTCNSNDRNCLDMSRARDKRLQAADKKRKDFIQS
jgi:hypothetical protein